MINISNLSCGYGKSIIIKDISFEIEKGEMFGIVGPNGSGKTTLLRAITGILESEDEAVSIAEQLITKMNEKEIARKIAVVSQYIDNSYMTVEEYVLLGRIPYYNGFRMIENKHDWETVDKYLQMTGIKDLKRRKISELSGGERQLAMIARALCQETEVILLDEPTSHLDISHQVEIMDLIRRLKTEEGLTIVTVLHDLNVASEYCDKIIMLKNGSVYSSGLPSEVLTYENIEKVYDTVVLVKENPVSGKPHVYMVTGR